MTKEERAAALAARYQELRAPEEALRRKGYRYLAGIDEVGRGPLAGPVVTCCTVLPADCALQGIDDSKKVTEKRREALSKAIREEALAVGIGRADAETIDEINILEATKKAMREAVAEADRQLRERTGEGISLLLIDAVDLGDLGIPQHAVIKGDATYYSIAAASIIAKVERDAFMKEMDAVYPGYAFASNKGYGTAAHYEGIREHGLTPLHRRTFLKNYQEKHSMGKTPQKYYAVRQGRHPGIYESWAACQKEVTGFKGAEFKSFPKRTDAEAYMANGSIVTKVSDEKVPRGYVAYVDGSFDKATKHYACGAVILRDGEEVARISRKFTDEAAAELHNVAGEIEGAAAAISWCLENGIPSVAIFHDYMGIGKWADDEWKANLPLTQRYKAFIKEARKVMRITFVKVKGHSGDRYNDIADALAREALGK